MALTVYEDLEQGTEAWLEARLGVLTASTIGQLISAKTLAVAANDTSRRLINQLAVERLTGRGPDPLTGRAIMRGHLDEPLARQYYADHYAPVTEIGFMKLETDDYTLGYSPDGLVGDDGLIEIKSHEHHHQLTAIITNTVPAMHMAQLQTGLRVSGRDWLDYVSFSAGMPLYVRRVLPDTAWQEAITLAAARAEKAIRELTSLYEERAINLVPTEYVNHFEDMEIF